jgi:glutamine amidotransferase
MAVLVDYNYGNFGSIVNMLRWIGTDIKVSKDAADIANAERLILPGVGSFDGAVKRLRELQLIPILNKRALVDKIPVLGICLGMQLMTKGSEEGSLGGLAWFDARTVRFRGDTMKVPHMGWNVLQPAREHRLFDGMDRKGRFYFMHSYHVICSRGEDVLATTLYGHEFASAIGSGNIVGLQFHPEKSHIFGMRLLKTFLTL